MSKSSGDWHGSPVTARRHVIITWREGDPEGTDRGNRHSSRPKQQRRRLTAILVGCCCLVLMALMLLLHVAGPLAGLIRTRHSMKGKGNGGRKLPGDSQGNIRGAAAADTHGQQKLISGTSGLMPGSSGDQSSNDGTSIDTSIRASLLPWQALERAAAVRRLATQQRQHHPAETKATSSRTISSSASGAAAIATNGKEGIPVGVGEQLSGLEAHALLDLFFTYLLPPSAGHGARATESGPGHILLPYELQQAEGKPLLELLRRIWDAHREVPAAGAAGIRGAASSAGRSSLPAAMAAKGASLGRAKDHCSTASGSGLIRQMTHAASQLGEASCGLARHAGSSLFSTKLPATGLPYVLLRRLSVAMLHLLHGGIKGGDGACADLVAEVCVCGSGRYLLHVVVSFLLP